jgi:hypothetical protein
MIAGAGPSAPFTLMIRKLIVGAGDTLAGETDVRRSLTKAVAVDPDQTEIQHAQGSGDLPKGKVGWFQSLANASAIVFVSTEACAPL